MSKIRQAGILLHPTSLPGPGPTATLDDVLPWLDFLQRAGIGLWQILPLNPVGEDLSPYNSSCGFAGNDRLLPDEAITEPIPEVELNRFRQQNHYWLPDYALFSALHQRYDHQPWYQWPQPLRDRHPQALSQAQKDLAEEIEWVEQRQWLFDRHWQQIHRACQQRGITLVGDLPYLCAHDSADVWAHRTLFQLDEEGFPIEVAGVPPDYFSETGQWWGNPVYHWENHQQSDFRWWIERFRAVLRWVDQVRFDHFRGLSGYWSIPATAEDARGGRWVSAPGDALLQRLQQTLEQEELPIIAEDLGLITTDVIALRERHRLSGMAVMQFGFDGSPDNPHLPANHLPGVVAYSGTHDNDTLLGWYQELDTETRQRVVETLAIQPRTPPPLQWQLLAPLLASNANRVIIPFQDILGLDSTARMNIPGVSDGNWRWRLPQKRLDPALADTLRAQLQHHNRALP